MLIKSSREAATHLPDTNVRRRHPPEIAIEPSPPDTAMASPPDPSSSTPDAAMEGQGATACSLAASDLAASGLGTPVVGLGDGGCCASAAGLAAPVDGGRGAPAAGLAEPAVGLAMPVDECCSAPAAGLAAWVDECLAPPDASAIALARTLLPTTPLQAVEYNLPVLEVQR